MIPKILQDEVDGLKRIGRDLDIVESSGQCYVLARKAPAHSPPWDRLLYNILIAIPITYDHAGLDAFYIEEPCAFNGAEHERVRGERITVSESTWRLVSWHYTAKHPWRRGSDSLETHLEHCAGFFLTRGVKND